MAEYRLTADDSMVIRNSDRASIPNDPANRDRVEYLAWLAAGGVPDPYIAPKPENFSMLSDFDFGPTIAEWFDTPIGA
jgi:hypothetical protein